MKKIFFLAAATFTLAACDQNEDNPAPSSVAVQVSATIGDGALSRASDNEWTPGDRIGITLATGTDLKYINMEYTTDGGEKFSGNTMYFYNPMVVTAYYPFKGEEGKAPGIIEAVTDAESQDPEIQPSIDFLWDQQDSFKVVDSRPEINFSFSHKMSKLTFVFKSGNDKTDVSMIRSFAIDGIILSGTFNTETGECKVKDEDPSLLSITTGEVKENEALPSLIVFPQAAQSVILTIVDSGDQKYSCNLNFGDNGIASGKEYQYTIIVAKTGLAVNGSIKPWISEQYESNAGSSD